jgi:hypothetical protein
MNAEHTIASDMILLEAELEIDRLKLELKETHAILENERKIHLRIALHADRMHLQLQAIKEAAIDELCSLCADGPENLKGLQEVE